MKIKYIQSLIGMGTLLFAIAVPPRTIAQEKTNLAAHTQAAQPAATDSDPNTLDYTSSWIGNSLPGNGISPDARRAVPIDADSIYATPDGKVFTNTTWDEGGRVVSIFKDGKLISPLNDQGGSPNWSEGGGDSIAADSKYIYKSNTAGGTNGGQGITVLNAADLSNASVSLTGSTTLGNSYAVYGIAISNGKIYVAQQDMNVVDVFNQSTLGLINSIPVPNPVRIAVDSRGGLWVSHQDQTPYPTNVYGNVDSFNADYGLADVDHFDSSGNLIDTILVPDYAEVSALWIDNLGFLLVGDEGPDQNIKVYGNILYKPTLVTTLGVKGGVYAGDDGERGKVGPWRFRGITGIATDAFENLYVSQNGWAMGHGNGHGLEVQSYNIFGQQNWSLDGLEFVSLAAADPKSPTDVFDPYHHFKVDYSQPAGQEATYVADTMNRFLYPDDLRITNILSTAQIQYIDGKKFLLGSTQHGTSLEIYRFEDSRSGPGKEIGIPCVAFDYGAINGGTDFVVQPTDGEFIWRDLNADGLMTLNEFEEPTTEGTYQGSPIPNEHRDGGYFYMDTNGDIWQVNYGTNTPPFEPSIHLRRYFFQGFDSFGAPMYDFNHMAIYSVPGDFPELSTVSGAIFKPEDSKGGTLYVSANGVPQESAFNQIARYDNWDKGSRKAKWIINVPFDPDPNNTWFSTSFDEAGQFIFVDFNTPHYTLIYNAKDGSYVGRFTPSAEIGGLADVGNTDEWQSEHAFKLDSGEIIVLREDDEFGKQIMYKWKPPSELTTFPAPPPPAGFVGKANDEEADLSWTLDPSILTYTVSRSSAVGGPYVPLQSASGLFGVSTVTDTSLSNGTTYYYMLSGLTETGSSQTAPVAVTPAPYGTTYEAENSILAGPQIFVQACSGCSGGAFVAAVVQGTSMTFNNVSVATAGTYAIRIYEVNGNQPSDWGLPTEPTIDINANGGAEIVSPPLPFTNSNWNVPGYVTVNVPLNAGANTIVLSVPGNAPSGDPCIDRIVVPVNPM